ncbi:MAG: hypothetical protein INH41_14635 [Myxococcaceae bacterium]|jgi:hypothetical protein|nr:hypothetical protein [Myxococcaceae bacterium]MCA3013615.1 hypothetical protein [Myxococcaceae bacterium]
MTHDTEQDEAFAAQALAALDAGEELDETLMDAAAPWACDRFLVSIQQLEGVVLTVGRESLAWLDRYLLEELQGEPMEELHELFTDAACFFGECILSEAGGVWSYAGQPAILFGLPTGGTRLVLPRARVEAAFIEGASQSLVALFDELVAARGPAEVA